MSLYLQIHWFSIFNSFMMVIFLVGLVSMILMRTLRKDYARYSKEDDVDDMERDLGDEYGWKQVHGDVFRPASQPLLFSALIGTGYQISFVVLVVIIFAIVGDLYTERGSMLSTAIFVYAATAPVNGYAGGSLYARMGGKKWIKQMVVSAFLLPFLVCSTAFFINFIAIYYHASRAIPFTTMVKNSFSNVKTLKLKFCIISDCCGFNLHFCHFAPQLGGHSIGPQPGRYSRLSLSHQCGA